MRQTWEETAPHQAALLRYLDRLAEAPPPKQRLFCRLFHRGVMFAGGAVARCRTCQRAFRCPWAAGGGR